MVGVACTFAVATSTYRPLTLVPMTKASCMNRHSATSPSMPMGFLWTRRVLSFMGSTVAFLYLMKKLTPAGKYTSGTRTICIPSSSPTTPLPTLLAPSLSMPTISEASLTLM